MALADNCKDCRWILLNNPDLKALGEVALTGFITKANSTYEQNARDGKRSFIYTFLSTPAKIATYYLQSQKLCFRERMQLQLSECTCTTSCQNLYIYKSNSSGYLIFVWQLLRPVLAVRNNKNESILRCCWVLEEKPIGWGRLEENTEPTS